MEIPPFTPQLVDHGQGLFYEDGRVLGAVDTTPGTLVIHEWSSDIPSQGHTTQALKWLREQGFSTIAANGVGTIDDGVGDSATCYWAHMLHRGLVDVLYDDEGNDVTQWAREWALAPEGSELPVEEEGESCQQRPASPKPHF